MLSALGLPLGGSVSEMREWHRAYVAQHNAMVDSGGAFQPGDVLRSVLAAKRLKDSEQAQAAKARALVAGAVAAVEAGGTSAAPPTLRAAFLDLVRATRRRDRHRMKSVRKRRKASRNKVADAADSSLPTAALPVADSSAWVAVFSDRVQRIFYFNQTTGVGQWEQPAGVPPLHPIHVPSGSGRHASQVSAVAPQGGVPGTLTQTLPYRATQVRGPIASAFAGGGAASQPQRGGVKRHFEEDEVVLLDSQEEAPDGLLPGAVEGGHGDRAGADDSVADTLVLTRSDQPSLTETQLQSNTPAKQPARSVFEETEEESQLLGPLNSPLPNALPQLPRRNTRSKNKQETASQASQDLPEAPDGPSGAPKLGAESIEGGGSRSDEQTSEQQLEEEAGSARRGRGQVTRGTKRGRGARGGARSTEPPPASPPATAATEQDSDAERDGPALSAAGSGNGNVGSGWCCPACTLEHKGSDALLEACKLCGTGNPAASALVRRTRRRRR